MGLFSSDNDLLSRSLVDILDQFQMIDDKWIDASQQYLKLNVFILHSTILDFKKAWVG